MKDQVLSIGQMKHLHELGVDTSMASMCWVKNFDHKYDVELYDPVLATIWVEWHPTFTLQDILEITPHQIKFMGHIGTLAIYDFDYIIYEAETRDIHLARGNNYIDTAYNMLCWLAENKLLEKEEKK